MAVIDDNFDDMRFWENQPPEPEIMPWLFLLVPVAAMVVALW